jgi:hydroxymethylpyrimidine pyrophosphatase-like HAD family hydrolase
MLDAAPSSHPTIDVNASASNLVLPAELTFYDTYSWCLDPHLTVRKAIDCFGAEVEKLRTVTERWQELEIATNMFLLSGALLNVVDECLRGPTLRMPRQLAALSLGRAARWTTDKWRDALTRQAQARVSRWREGWQRELRELLALIATAEAVDRSVLEASGRRLAALLQSGLPPELVDKQIGVPTPFRRLDLTHLDVLSLGRQFAARFPDRRQPILILGVRTSGSYFVPLLEALLGSEGYDRVSSLTIQPNKGPGRLERQKLIIAAKAGCTALVVDDPPYTGRTVVLAYEIARQAGFAPGKLRVLVPVHPAQSDWFRHLPERTLISLDPEQWYKRQLLAPMRASELLGEYYREQGFIQTVVVASSYARELNAHLRELGENERSTRLKRVYEVHLQRAGGEREVRYVLAKSVGWGWLGYHAFLAGYRLRRFVPPLLGLREGILYMEWVPDAAPDHNKDDRRQQLIETSARYVAARARRLSLKTRAEPRRHLRQHENGLNLLAKVLSKAYGPFVTDMLMLECLKRWLCQQGSFAPALIDGRMRRTDWIAAPQGWLKADYEHHGMGKSELNVLDPAYDLAETILDLRLSPREEAGFVRSYVESSGDIVTEERLFMNKLLAGLWAIESAQASLFGKRHAATRQQALHERFMRAWDFLTVHAARYCGRYSRPPPQPGWRAPLVMLDVDGVLDRRIFGFPCTTAAGIQALSLLHAHGFSVALNSARAAAEVREYCQAYSLAGGVAEHGSYIWDALARRGRVLIDDEARRQLDLLRGRLRDLPGVFLDDRHQYSIRAFTYKRKARGLRAQTLESLNSFSVGAGLPTPLPTLVLDHLITSLRLDQLSFHHTTIDTTVVAKHYDKGTGLSALADWVSLPRHEIIAVGDSEPDLAMFRLAGASFAPGQIGCIREARLLGCKSVARRYQRGLLDIARLIVHPSGKKCARCAEAETGWSSDSRELFLALIQAADRLGAGSTARALFNPANFKLFVR